ncbi:uncharacterized protein N7496_001043 [Penicillium cataractarum]|uniref:Uncharacterized protein n=1 Tax=Penicillium cataractarum TaxID=2100454 RepID=A0A9X0B6I8_9EURO|nr:uncharacterized protein N7496_001043 [Penicillium cataractarum]KAJ5389975.1 hypothetical protein N7496_001043 [Penicillium cataractarum]
MTSKRPLFIPHKRPLLPPITHTTSNSKQVYKVLNPSTIPATTHMKPPLDDNQDEETYDSTMNKPARIEFSFASSPQPFLDPPTWEAMLKRAQATAASVSAGENESERASNSTRRRGENLSESSGSAETPDQQRIRREREAEYGSMAIRGRSSVSGRGKRTRASGRGYWGGRY